MLPNASKEFKGFMLHGRKQDVFFDDITCNIFYSFQRIG